MANYQYDESGVLASYFALTFLTLILIPLTFSFLPSRQEPTLKNVCNCSECEAKEARMKRSKSRSIFKPRLGVKSLSTIGGWALFAFLCYKIATTEVNSKPYDPFEILGLGHGTAEKEIKRHYKKLSLKFHPDKVKLAENQTMEAVEAHFVELTKAYKSLTDEEIRNNLEKYGHPDGKQEFSMGLALPTWVVESKNNFWVLGAYGLLFAGLLPMLVGRWWFGSRKMTKDGVLGATAQLFFKNVREDSSPETLIYLLARAWDIEQGSTFNSAASEPALAKLEAAVKEIVGDSYGKTAKIPTTQGTVATRRALALLYAHLLRIQIQDSSLQQELDLLLPATQTYLGSMVSMALAHNWLACTSSIMHLHSYIVQATFPGSNPLLAYPSVTKDEAKLGDGGVVSYIKALEDKHDPRAEIIQRVADKWGHLQVIDPQFKVIGERIVTPGAIVQLVFKLRLTPPTQAPTEPSTELTPEQRKQEIREEDAFLTGKEDTAALLPGLQVPGYVHAPYYPANRKPSWWVMIGDQKMNRVIVPPIRVTDVPYANPSKAPKDHRMYKLQFQAPPQVGVYTFQLAFVSDTFVGEDVRMFLPLKVEELTSDDEQDQEDEISEPDEDTLAGQMAAMRGEKVKKSPYHGDGSDDESSTDDDQSSGSSDSSSDSDSDSD